MRLRSRFMHPSITVLQAEHAAKGAAGELAKKRAR
jgi:hypothetical protein